MQNFKMRNYGKKNILIDTSIWIEYFKNNSKYVDFIDVNLNIDNIVTTGLIIAELLHGVKSEAEKLLLLKYIGAITYVECIYKDWVSSGEILFDLKKKGKIIPLSDALIASIAKRINASILTLDMHFKLIPDVSLIKL